MGKKTNNKPSQEIIDEAMQIARATQKPGQSKDQTKLISQGIEKGIALYKKQQKEKARAADKAKKQLFKNKDTQIDVLPSEHVKSEVQIQKNYFPWILLGISWVLFGGYIILV